MQRGDVILTIIQEQVTENLMIDRWNEDRILPRKSRTPGYETRIPVQLLLLHCPFKCLHG